MQCRFVGITPASCMVDGVISRLTLIRALDRPRTCSSNLRHFLTTNRQNRRGTPSGLCRVCVRLKEDRCSCILANALRPIQSGVAATAKHRRYLSCWHGKGCIESVERLPVLVYHVLMLRIPEPSLDAKPLRPGWA